MNTDGHDVDSDFNSIGDRLMEVGFENTSWINDVCPSFEKGTLRVFVDRADSSEREITTMKRFCVYDTESDTVHFETESTDELFNRIMEFVK